MRTLWLATVSLLAGLVAIYSRCFDRTFFDGTMSGLLQNEGRAAIEHLLTAVAITLAALPVFVLRAACMGIKELFNRSHTSGDDTANLSGKQAILYAILCTAVLGPFSAAVDFLIEVDQAYRSVGFRSPPRGFMQWEQVFASIAGAMLAMGFAWFALAPVVGRATAVEYVTDKLRSLKNRKSTYRLMLACILVLVNFWGVDVAIARGFFNT